MVAVGNDAGIEFVMGQLFPDVIGMATYLAVRPVAEMGGHTRSGQYGVADGLWFGGGMAQSDCHTGRGQFFDKRERPFPLRSEGKEFDTPARSLLKALELVPIRVAGVFEGMCAAGTIFRGEIGPFH